MPPVQTTDFSSILDLFQQDDGSLPDIFVQNLRTDEVESIFCWVFELTATTASIPVCSKEQQQETCLSYKEAVQAFNLGKIESFRCLLQPLMIDTVTLPELSIALEDFGEISFDYRMGNEWGMREIKALLEFLSRIKDQTPAATIMQADEGMHTRPNHQFSHVFTAFYQQRRNDQ